MFNDHLSDELAKELIEERVREAETYSLQKRLGYGGGAAWWIFDILVVIAAVTIGLLL